MKRHEFITLLGGAAVAWPLTARAQQPAMPVVGFLTALSEAGNAQFVAAFNRGLNETGFVDGRNVKIEYRYSEGHYDRLPALAQELVRREVNVIATTGGSPSARAAHAATTTIPIVFTMGDIDPVQAGLVASLSRPGGNMTGLSLLGGALGAKRLEILHEIVPNADVIAVLATNNRSADPYLDELQAAARTLGRRLVVLRVADTNGFDGAFQTLVEQRAGALIVTADVIFTNGRKELTALAARHRVPAIYQWPDFVTSGGLISYGTSIIDAYRQVGLYVGRILKGEKPADLPVLQPTKFDLVINLKTAKALGLKIPDKLLFTADEVIE
jgi:putative tryptophan/tyrosine transport system substrate-binding protein